MKQSTATIAGTIVVAGGKTQLRVSGSYEMLNLAPEAGATPITQLLDGKSALVTGDIPETPKGKPFGVQYRSITEQ